MPPNLPHPAQGSLYIVSLDPISGPSRERGEGDCDATSPALYKMSSVSGAGPELSGLPKSSFSNCMLRLFLFSHLFLFSFFFCFISLLIIFSLWCFGHFGQLADCAGSLATQFVCLCVSVCVYVPHYGSWQFNFMYCRTQVAGRARDRRRSQSWPNPTQFPTKHLLKSFASNALPFWPEVDYSKCLVKHGRVLTRIHSRIHIRLRIRLRIRGRILICTCLQFAPKQKRIAKPLMCVCVSVHVAVCVCVCKL